MYPESPKAKFKVHPPERLEHCKCSCCYEPRSSLHSNAQSTHISLNLAHGATASTSPSVIQSQGGDKHTSCFLLTAALYPVFFTDSFVPQNPESRRVFQLIILFYSGHRLCLLLPIKILITGNQNWHISLGQICFQTSYMDWCSIYFLSGSKKSYFSTSIANNLCL